MAPIYPSVRREPLDIKAHTDGDERVVLACVSSSYQGQYHPVAPIEDITRFGDGCVDPAFITMQLNYSFLGGLWALKGAQAPASSGSIHASESFSMHRAVKLGETIVIRRHGEVRKEPHRLGYISSSTFLGEDSTGQLVWEVTREGITIDPDAAKPETDVARFKTALVQKDPRAGRRFVRRVQFTPEIVVGYCNDFDGFNPIHHDPAVAKAAGFKNPIWAGAQGIHIVMEQLCKTCGNTVPQKLRASVKLRRAVCWDEAVELWFGQAVGCPVGVGSYVLLRVADDFKIALEMEVHSLDNATGAQAMIPRL